MHATFSGNSRRTRNVDLSGQNRNPFASAWQPTGASQTVSHAQAERQKRQQERDRLNAARRIQRTWRSHKVRKLLRESRREAFDNFYKSDTISSDSRVESCLPLVLDFFRPNNAQDLRRLIQLASDIHQKGVECLVSSLDQHGRYRLSRLATVVVAALEQRDTCENGTLLDILEQMAVLSPQCLSRIMPRFYTLLGQAAVNPTLSSDRAQQIRRTAVSLLEPGSQLDTRSERAAEAYLSFAFHFLAKEGLALNTSKDDTPLRHVRLDKLSSAIIDLYTYRARHSWGADSQLWLLANLIDLQRAQPTPSEQFSYMEALQLQLSNLVSQINLRYPDKRDDSSSLDEKESEEGQGVPATLPGYVKSRIATLVDRDGISALLATLTSNALNVEGASVLAGYIMTLIRCFPGDGDDIRMRLFLGDVACRDGQTISVIKFLWEGARQTRVYRRVEDDKASTTGALVKSYLSKTFGAEPSEDGEWRLILLFLELYTFVLRLSDDDDFFSCIHPSVVAETQEASRIRSCGLTMDEVKSLTTFLKNLAFTLHHDGPGIVESVRSTEGSADAKLDSYFGHASHKASAEGRGSSSSGAKPGMNKLDLNSLRGVITTALRMLYERDSRRPFLPANHWLMTSKFDMSRFVDAVVIEQERQQKEMAAEGPDEEGADQDEEGDASMGGIESQPHTMAGQRLNRHAHIERLRLQQRKAQRDRTLSVIGPKLEVLKHMPFVIPFTTRVEIFRKLIDTDKLRRRNGMDPETWRMSMVNNIMMPGTTLPGRHRGTITRGREFDDAYDEFYHLGEGLKEPIQIQFVDKFGDVEAGIDGGGVTKEFLTSAIDSAFSHESEDYFVANKQGLNFPNPVILDRRRDLLHHATPAEINESIADILRQFEFLGRLVGKCMYEGILVDIAFAGFFLLKWATGQQGENAYRGNLNDLRDMDEETYQGMLKLKYYNGDVASELGLDFTIEDQISGPGEPTRTITRQLIPNGDKVPVTNDNRLLYISYMARHRLVVQPLAQTAAFLRGLRSMIAPSWLSMFNQNELQRLVGGDSSEIDVDDLKRNTVYSGLYDPGHSPKDHPTIDLFWDVVRSFSDQQRRLLLKYVTSTPRAPLLGFSQLSPRFSIRDSGTDEGRLPSTSTCVNLLKLPIYSDAETLRKKLLQAIESGAGFDLS